MITDEGLHIRQLSFCRVLKARGQEVKGVRMFCVPQINFNATDYMDSTDWNQIFLTPPPLLSKVSVEKIAKKALENKTEKLHILRFVWYLLAMHNWGFISSNINDFF